MPRNFDVMEVCDELERRLINPLVKVSQKPGKDFTAVTTEIVDESCPICERHRRQTRDRVAALRKKRASERGE
jgi:hypothetical protein